MRNDIDLFSSSRPAPVGAPRNAAKAGSRRQLERFFDLSLDMLATSSAAGYLTRLNPAWERTLGWSREELMAQPMSTFFHPDDRVESAEQRALLAEVAAPPLVDFVNRFRAHDGTYHWLKWTVVSENGVGYCVVRDVTGRRRAESEKDHASSLTRAVVDNVADGLAIADTTGRTTFINPAGLYLLGYDSSEELLDRDFHLMFHHHHLDGSAYAAEDCPMSLVRADGEPRYVQEDTFWRKDGSPLPVAYSAAPIDLGSGCGSVVAFRDVTALQVERERVRAEFGDVAWFEEVRQAVANNRFVLYRQPIIDLASGRTSHHELLLRMMTPTGGIIGPGLFLPAAEKYGLIVDIDRWVLTHAIELAATGLPVAVNLSADSVGRVDILLHIERELLRTRADPENVTFEVTETAVMRDLADGRRFADRLAGLGCAFALDDFGTGYGSLTYLRQLPISFLKIDVQFVRRATEDEEDRNLVKAIVSIAGSLGKLTIAEGVEDEETLDLLRELGVDYAQGFYLGVPAPFSSNPG